MTSWPCRPSARSSPLPASTESSPSPRHIRSSPPSARTLASPAPDTITSGPAVPGIRSASAVPTLVAGSPAQRSPRADQAVVAPATRATASATSPAPVAALPAIASSSVGSGAQPYAARFSPRGFAARDRFPASRRGSADGADDLLREGGELLQVLRTLRL